MSVGEIAGCARMRRRREDERWFGDRNPINSPSGEPGRDRASLVLKDGVRVCVVRIMMMWSWKTLADFLTSQKPVYNKQPSQTFDGMKIK